MYKILLLSFIGFVFSAQVTLSNAEKVASNIFKEFNNTNRNFDISFTESIIEENNNLIYVFHLNPTGFD